MGQIQLAFFLVIVGKIIYFQSDALNAGDELDNPVGSVNVIITIKFE